MMRFGIVSLFLSIGLAVGGLILLLATDTLVEPLSGVLCPSDQTLSRETSSFRGETNVYFYCVNDDGVIQDEVTGWTVVIAFMLFIPMVVSILLLVLGGVRNASRPLEVTVGSHAKLDDVLNPVVGKSRQMKVGRDELTLREKLQQLQDAYEARLINKWEYDDRKEQILDDFTE